MAAFTAANTLVCAAKDLLEVGGKPCVGEYPFGLCLRLGGEYGQRLITGVGQLLQQCANARIDAVVVDALLQVMLAKQGDGLLDNRLVLGI
nr:hypothetical protein [Motiliproteus coralliicola]